MTMTRSQFLRLLTGASAGALGLSALAGCKDDEPTTPDAAKPVDAKPIDGAPANCLQNGTNTAISFNHGHAMTVAKADIMAGVDKTYNIMGTSLHPHTVVITAAQFAMLAANTMVMVTSSTDAGHSHPVTVTCA